MDTATPSTAVAVWAPDGPAVERRDDPAPGERPGHAARLLALVDEVVPGWDAIERIAVGVGPGGFTGLRIGIATARALAQARDLPLVGVSSLAALAAPHDGPVVAVIDARRGEVFAASPSGSSRDRWPSATGRYAFGRSSNGPGRPSRRTTPRCTA
jgi:tRNA threonylcarbamoyladenosine biosynthesis protein TsaB